MATMLENQAKELPVEKPKKTSQNKISSIRYKCHRDFIDITMRTLTPIEKDIWFILWDKLDGSSMTSRVAIQTLMKLANKSKTNILKGLSALKNKKLVFIVKQGNSITHECNVYKICATTEEKYDLPKKGGRKKNEKNL
jgi:hypothetical protein